jgi:membrane-associated phospholipid phosphatase
MSPRGLWIFVGAWGIALATAQAQPACSGRAVLDVRLLCMVYHTDSPLLRTYLQVVDDAAYPFFGGLTAIAWGAALYDRMPEAAAGRITLAVVTTAVVTLALKTVIARPRPFTQWEDITARGSRPASHAFPSGHAALAFALATSWSLETKRVYVTVPAYAWAGSVAVARVWRGVHYPSDVLAGALLGSGMALLVYALW